MGLEAHLRPAARSTPLSPTTYSSWATGVIVTRVGGDSYSAGVGVQGTGDAMRAILSRRLPEHPYAQPVAPGAHGLWLIQVGGAAPSGYVTTRSKLGGWVYDVYAHCRDDNGSRPWLRTFSTLNTAAAWMVQHEAEVRALIASSTPEPEAWPPSG